MATARLGAATKLYILNLNLRWMATAKLGAAMTMTRLSIVSPPARRVPFPG